MKKILFSLVTLILCINAFAQSNVSDGSERNTSKPHYGRRGPKPALYITTSTGFNNNTGIAGLSIDVPFAQVFSIDAGIGISTWGYKEYAGLKYYFSPHQRGLAIGVGVTHNGGLQNFQENLETVYGDHEDVTLNLQPQTNIMFALYRYWNLGRKYNRFYMELGWSIPVTSGDKYEQTAGAPLSDNADKAVKLLSPGGFILGIGFSFGVR